MLLFKDGGTQKTGYVKSISISIHIHIYFRIVLSEYSLMPEYTRPINLIESNSYSSGRSS